MVASQTKQPCLPICSGGLDRLVHQNWWNHISKKLNTCLQRDFTTNMADRLEQYLLDHQRQKTLFSCKYTREREGECLPHVSVSSMENTSITHRPNGKYPSRSRKQYRLLLHYELAGWAGRSCEKMSHWSGHEVISAAPWQEQGPRGSQNQSNEAKYHPGANLQAADFQEYSEEQNLASARNEQKGG